MFTSLRAKARSAFRNHTDSPRRRESAKLGLLQLEDRATPALTLQFNLPPYAGGYYGSEQPTNCGPAGNVMIVVSGTISTPTTVAVSLATSPGMAPSADSSDYSFPTLSASVALTPGVNGAASAVMHFPWYAPVDIVEPTEHFNLTIASVTNATISGDVTKRVSISDNSPTVTFSAFQDALEYDRSASPAGPKAGKFRFTRTGGDRLQPLTVYYSVNPSSMAVSVHDYDALPGSAVIPANQDFVDVLVNPMDDGLWEWHGPESVVLDLLPSIRYRSNPATWTILIREVGSPTFTPIVDDTLTVADDFTAVGKPIRVGYQVFGDHVLRQGSIAFSILFGAAEITGPSEVSFATDAAGNAYVWTTVVPTAPTLNWGDLKIGGTLKQTWTVAQNQPAPKPLAPNQAAGVEVDLSSEGSERAGGSIVLADNRIRGKHTPVPMKDRIPPRTATRVIIVVRGALPPGGKLGHLVINQVNGNGTVEFQLPQNGNWVNTSDLSTFTPEAAVNGVSKTPFDFRGATQTGQGKGVNLVLRVVDGNKPDKLLRDSEKFGVAAIPKKIVMSGMNNHNPTVNSPQAGEPFIHAVLFGVRYGIIIESDSENTTDLDKVTMQEKLANLVAKNTAGEQGKGFFAGMNFDFGPPFTATDPGIGDDIGPRFGVNAASDAAAAAAGRTMLVNLTNTSLGGTVTFDQYIVFSDARTVSNNLLVNESGFTHNLEVLDPGLPPPGAPANNKATLKVMKKPAAVTSGNITVAAGGAANPADTNPVTIEVTKP